MYIGKASEATEELREALLRHAIALAGEAGANSVALTSNPQR
ncbi:MAG TPA: hypothetical protein VI524_03445 [Anaerolineales bacterium]|nr:hypothetical protein [Anaerolineales bacterium]